MAKTSTINAMVIPMTNSGPNFGPPTSTSKNRVIPIAELGPATESAIYIHHKPTDFIKWTIY